MKYSLKAKLCLKLPTPPEEENASRKRARRKLTTNKIPPGSDSPVQEKKQKTRTHKSGRTVIKGGEIAKSYYQRVQGPKMRLAKSNLVQQVKHLQGPAWNENSTWLTVLEMATAYLHLAHLSRR